MRYPEKLETGDMIGVTAPSAGIVKEVKQKRLDNAKSNLEKLGYKYKETENVRTDFNGISSRGEERAEQFMRLWKDNNVKAIIAADGGDFLIEMLEYLDFEKLKKLPPKWFQGFSDITTLSFLLTTICDIATIYGPNIKGYGMRNLYRNFKDSLKLMNRQEIIQDSFEKYEENWLEKIIENQKNGVLEEKEEDPYEEYKLVNEVKWKNLNDEKQIKFTGRSIGGCFDSIENFIGTKYDNVKEYIEKYKSDGIIWFLEIFDMSTTRLYLKLLQMKNAGYFENCNGIIFGRSLMLRKEYDMDFKETIKKAINNLNIPVIYDVDIGHLAPQLNIVNGAILDITSENGRGNIKTYFR